MKTKLTADQLASMSPWNIAEHYGLVYSGDGNPFDHGGFFYDYRDWVSWEYASVIEVYQIEGEVYTITGSISKPDDMTGAFQCIGISDPDDKNNVHCQVEAVKAYRGIEWDKTVWKCTEDNEEGFWEALGNALQEMSNQ